MRFLARVMESRSPLLHSMGSSKIAAVGRQPQAQLVGTFQRTRVPVSHHCYLLPGSSRPPHHPQTGLRNSPLRPKSLGLQQ